MSRSSVPCRTCSLLVGFATASSRMTGGRWRHSSRMSIGRRFASRRGQVDDDGTMVAAPMLLREGADMHGSYGVLPVRGHEAVVDMVRVPFPPPPEMRRMLRCAGI